MLQLSFSLCSLPTQKFVENAEAKTFLRVKRGFIGGVIEWITNENEEEREGRVRHERNRETNARRDRYLIKK